MPNSNWIKICFVAGAGSVGAQPGVKMARVRIITTDPDLARGGESFPFVADVIGVGDLSAAPPGFAGRWPPDWQGVIAATDLVLHLGCGEAHGSAAFRLANPELLSATELLSTEPVAEIVRSASDLSPGGSLTVAIGNHTLLDIRG